MSDKRDRHAVDHFKLSNVMSRICKILTSYSSKIFYHQVSHINFCLLIDQSMYCIFVYTFTNVFFQELYARSHGNVCVIFASIPNFKDFWSEWDTSRKLECLRLLNEIVCEFDKVCVCMFHFIFSFVFSSYRNRNLVVLKRLKQLAAHIWLRLVSMRTNDKSMTIV